MLTKRESKTTVELGAREGESTIPLLFAAKETGGQVFSFDLDDCQDAKRVVSEFGLSSHWQFTRADDLAVDRDEPIDHLFVDTNHTYEQTIAELKKFEPFVREGGIITMHDNVTYPDVGRAASDYLRGRHDLARYDYLNNNGLTAI
jgi:predicted O-methyltransferase YrrM